jgi:hypothetical protein
LGHAEEWDHVDLSQVSVGDGGEDASRLHSCRPTATGGP